MSRKICFGTDNVDDEVFRRGVILFQLLEPDTYVVERGRVGDVVYENGSIRAAVVHWRLEVSTCALGVVGLELKHKGEYETDHATKSFLPGSIPKLQPDLEAVHDDLFRDKERARGRL